MYFADTVDNSMKSWDRRIDRSGLNEFFTQLGDVADVMSCLALGTSAGEFEITFIEQTMPDLKYLTTVEPEVEANKELKSRVNLKLPNVTHNAVEGRIQDWTGPTEPVDAILMFRFLYYFDEEERTKLFQECLKKWLKPNGKLIIIHGDEESFYNLVSQKLYPGVTIISTETIAAELEKAGFSVEKRVRNCTTIDVTDLDETFTNLFFQGTVGHEKIGFERVVECIKCVVGDGKTAKYHNSALVVKSQGHEA